MWIYYISNTYTRRRITITSICLIRHGETDWNVLGKLQGSTDIPLNSKGILQAQECRQYLKENTWDVIVTSPLARAKKTAEVINQGLNIPLVEMDNFKERFFGDAEGMTVLERSKAFPDKNYPNQEDRESFNSRIMEGLAKVSNFYRGCSILLVAHGAVINAILSHFSNGEIGSGQTRLVNACISNIALVGEEWKVTDFNQTNHLSKDR